MPRSSLGRARHVVVVNDRDETLSEWKRRFITGTWRRVLDLLA